MAHGIGGRDRVMAGELARSEAEVRALRDMNDLRDERRHDEANALAAKAEVPDADVIIARLYAIKHEIARRKDDGSYLQEAWNTLWDDLSDGIGRFAKAVHRVAEQ